MRFVPTVIHGVADYIVGVVVIALPYFFGWDGSLKVILVALGGTVLLYSAATDYEVGIIPYLRIRFHLILDGFFGVAMLVLPFFFRIPANGRPVIFAIGSIAFVLALTTKTRAKGTYAEGAAS